MSDIIVSEKFDDNYKNWILQVSTQFRTSQIKASIKVNDEMLRFYWELGRDIESLKENASWGSHI